MFPSFTVHTTFRKNTSFGSKLETGQQTDARARTHTH